MNKAVQVVCDSPDLSWAEFMTVLDGLAGDRWPESSCAYIRPPRRARIEAERVVLAMRLEDRVHLLAHGEQAPPCPIDCPAYRHDGAVNGVPGHGGLSASKTTIPDVSPPLDQF